MIREWLVGRGLLDDVQEVPVDDRYRRGFHDIGVFDGTVAADDGCHSDGNIAVGMNVSVEPRNAQSVVVREFGDLASKQLLIRKLIRIRGKE